MTRRGYGQYCGLARALELVGERWALLIIRDLLVGPRRFTDLKRGLPRIPSNILTDRLKDLEEAGLLQRRLLPRPGGSVVYVLTGHGAELEDAVIALSRWGARSLGEMRPGEIVTCDSMIMAMRTIFRPESARGLDAVYELRMGDIVFTLSIADGRLTAYPGAPDEPDLVIEAGPEIKEMFAGEIMPAEALADGIVRIRGDPALFGRFAEAFRI